MDRKEFGKGRIRTNTRKMHQTKAVEVVRIKARNQYYFSTGSFILALTTLDLAMML